MTISKHVLLTDKYLQTFARSYVLPGERKEIWDTQLAAFGVRLTESGVMSFIVRARMPGAKNPTTITLGHYPDITLKEARDRAIDAVRNLKAGKHPQALKAEKLEAERTRRAEAARKKAVVAKAKADFIRGCSGAVDCGEGETLPTGRAVRYATDRAKRTCTGIPQADHTSHVVGREERDPGDSAAKPEHGAASSTMGALDL